MRALSIFLGGGLFLSALSITGLAEPVEIIQRYQPGKVYTYKSVNVSDMNMPAGDQVMQAKMNMTQEYEIRTEEASQGVQGTLGFTKAAMSMEMNGAQMMNLDSENEESLKGPEAEVLKQMLDVKISAVYGPRGEVLEMGAVEGGGAMMEEVMDGAMLEQLMRQAGDSLPKEPLEVGEGWEAAIEMPVKQLGGDMKVVMNMTLDSVDEATKQAHISFTGDVSLVAEENLLGMKTNKLEGTWVHDLEQDQMKQFKQMMDLEMTAPGADQVIPIVTTTETTLLSVTDK